MKKRWINIPAPRYPISLRYFFLWVIAPVKPFIFTNVSKINNKKIFEYVFNFANLFLRWPVKITYEKKIDLFKLVDGSLVTYIGRRQYLKLYSKGIKVITEKKMITVKLIHCEVSTTNK